MHCCLSVIKHGTLGSLIALSTFVFWPTKVYSQTSGRTGPAAISPLLEGASCRTFSSNGYEILKVGDTEVSVGRQLYTSRLRLYSQRSQFGTLVCKVDERYDILELQMAVTDAAVYLNPVITANIYQGGNLLYTHSNLVSGDMKNVTLDLHTPTIDHPDDVAIEIICHSTSITGRSCPLHFTEALLIGGDTFPLRLPQSSTSNPAETASTQQRSTSSWKDLENSFEELGDAIDDLFDLF